MPQVGPLKDLKNIKVDEKEFTRVVAIIDSMTPKSARTTCSSTARGGAASPAAAGTTVNDVNNLLKQYAQARKMMKTMSGGLLGKKLGKMKLPFPLNPFGG